MSALEYEWSVVEKHRELAQTWHWSNVPEDRLFDAGYIHDYSKHRSLRLMNKKQAAVGVNRLRDYGLDGLAMETLLDGSVVYHGIQAKCYSSRKVTAGDIGSFLTKQITMNLYNPKSRGFLYTTSPLEKTLEDEVAQPDYLIRHILYQPQTKQLLPPPVKTENELVLRDYQQKALDNLIDGANALCIPCRMGKTVVAGHHLLRYPHRGVLVLAPLKISVENLRERLSCFLPDHKPLLVDSDVGGTTDEKEITTFLEENDRVVIYSTFKSARDVLSEIHLWEDFQVIVDEAHNATKTLCDWIAQFPYRLAMSATFPEEIRELLEIENSYTVPYSVGIEGRYIVDYTLWLPMLTTLEDGSTIADGEIPLGFEQYPKSLALKALYHAVCMLRTGSRRCIVYLSDQKECDEYMKVCRDVFENYHGLDVWMGKITSDVSREERKDLLHTFETGPTDIFHLLMSVRILDEAVDIPACDSEFITSVGERSSDIRFFQRAQRGSTLDPKNPGKHNHIFVWADGWESCLGALQLLKSSDPEFHKKVRHASIKYDGTSVERRQRKEKEEVERETFTKWSGKILCESFEERAIRKAKLLLKFVEDNGRVPKQREEYEGVKIGKWWGTITQGSRKDVYEYILSANKILKEDFERVQKVKEEKKDKEEPSPEDKGRLLLDFVEKHKRVPKYTEQVDGVKIGIFWDVVKQGSRKDVYESILSANKILKEDYERLQKVKEEKKDKEEPSPEDKGRLLLDFVEKHKKVPKSTDQVDGVKIGKWWGKITQGRRKDVYESILSANKILKEDFERVQKVKEEKKDKEEPSPEDKGRLLLDFVEKHKRLPKYTDEHEGMKIGLWWVTVKQGKCKEVYGYILSANKIIKEEYERVQKVKEEKKDKEKLSPEDKARLLLDFVEKHKRLPKYTEEYNGVKIGQFWVRIKQGKCKEIYESILSTNKIPKEEYERVQKVKEEKLKGNFLTLS